MMTPYEKAKAEEGRVNYCDECEQFKIVGDAAYCKVDGKLIHPIMMARGQGTGPAWNCKKRRKPMTNADRLRAMTDEELAEWIETIADCRMCNIDEKHCSGSGLNSRASCMIKWLYWLRQEAPHDQP